MLGKRSYCPSPPTHFITLVHIKRHTCTTYFFLHVTQTHTPRVDIFQQQLKSLRGGVEERDLPVWTQVGLLHLAKQEDSKVGAAGSQDHLVGRETHTIHHKCNICVLSRLEQVQKVTRNVLKVLHIAQDIEIDAHCGIPG